MSKVLNMILFTLLTGSAFGGDFDQAAQSLQGNFTLVEEKGLFDFGKSEVFELDVTYNRVPGEKTGDIEFTSKEFGKCKGSYKVGYEDEQYIFDIEGYTIEANTVMCASLANEEYKWISIAVVFPKEQDLDDFSEGVRGQLSIRHYGSDYKFKKYVDIQKNN